MPSPQIKVIRVRNLPSAGGGGGSFLSNSIARVDPSGNDATGVVGDLGKPFLTVQAAINAFQAVPGIVDLFPIIDIGNNRYFTPTVTTSLRRIRFMGTAEEINSLGAVGYYSKVCKDLIITGTDDARTIELFNCEIESITSETPHTLEVKLYNAGIPGHNGAITAVGIIYITGNGASNPSGVMDVVTSSGGAQISLRNIFVDTIDSTGSNVVADGGSLIRNINAANNVSLIDSRVYNFNGASGATTYADVLLNADNIVFHNSDPHVAGAGYWVGGVLTKSAG